MYETVVAGAVAENVVFRCVSLCIFKRGSKRRRRRRVHTVLWKYTLGPTVACKVCTHKNRLLLHSSTLLALLHSRSVSSLLCFGESECDAIKRRTEERRKEKASQSKEQGGGKEGNIVLVNGGKMKLLNGCGMRVKRRRRER